MTVHLLKNKSDDAELGRQDPYEQLIPSYRFVPIMDYECINLDELEGLLKDEFDAIIVTSQRAVDSLKVVLNNDKNLSKEQKLKVLNKPVYTVGPTTAQRLSMLQFSNVNGADTGNGIALANEMVQDTHIKPNSRFLFVAGEVHRRQLPDKLEAAGHKVTTVIVYRTVGNPNIEHALVDEVKNNDWIVFFSPSHTQKVLEFLENTDKHVKIAAIGPTTEEFLQENGIAVTATASEPSAQGLMKAISI